MLKAIFGLSNYLQFIPKMFILLRKFSPKKFSFSQSRYAVNDSDHYCTIQILIFRY